MNRPWIRGCAALLLLVPAGTVGGDEPPAKPAPPTSPVLVEPDAALMGIRISVFNATGNKPLAAFRVIAGVRSGVSDEFEKRAGRPVVNWQPHTLQVGKDGDYVWPLTKAYDEMALRVEADGFQPQVWYWIQKQQGPKHIVFQLAEDPGVAGRVLSPDGKAAAGATIALAMVQRDAVLDGGRLRHADAPRAEKPSDQWRRPVFVKADAAGRFRLPIESEPAAVLIVHDSGVRELAYDAWVKSPEVKLQGWGRIEGRILWKDKPGADEPVTVSIHRDEYGYPGIVAQYEKQKTDANGKFVFDRVLPGHVQLSRPTPVSGGGEAILEGMFAHIQVKAGEPTPAVIGGQGRQVSGKLTGRDSWDGVSLRVHLAAPHFGFGGDDEQWKAFAALQSGPLGPLFFRTQIKPAADGTFHVGGVLLPGRYQLFVAAPGVENSAAYRQFTLEAETLDAPPKPFDLGEIPVKPAAPAKQADLPAVQRQTDLRRRASRTRPSNAATRRGGR